MSPKLLDRENLPAKAAHIEYWGTKWEQLARQIYQKQRNSLQEKLLQDQHHKYPIGFHAQAGKIS
jgi:hypothetical protein